jgi:hypothetical protein
MRRTLMLTAAFLLLAPALWDAAQACGDKFLMVGRGARFARAYASVYPGHLVVYARPSLGTKAMIADVRLHKLLRLAGHKVSVIQDGALLEQAVRSTTTDIVLVDLTDAPQVDQLAQSSALRPSILPVRPQGRSAELDRLQKQFAGKLKDSDHVVRWLDAVEDAMKARVIARRSSKS